MPTVVVDIPDQGLATRFGVTMPVGKTEFHMDKIPGGARADAAYTITYKHGDHVRVHHCHFCVEYNSATRQLIYYFQQEGGRRYENDLWEHWDDKSLRSCMAELGASCLRIAGISKDTICEKTAWVGQGNNVYLLRLLPQKGLGRLGVYAHLDGDGTPLTMRLLEFTSRDYSEYRMLGEGKYDPFLMAVLGTDYWDKFCIMASLGIFKESEND